MKPSKKKELNKGTLNLSLSLSLSRITESAQEMYHQEEKKGGQINFKRY
jgi:hypothetical protein